ncbi:MAG: hypothetical protein IJ183_02255 [Prevotella sp.]|nr:hypothetical protein [Prevotella sp.]
MTAHFGVFVQKWGVWKIFFPAAKLVLVGCSGNWRKEWQRLKMHIFLQTTATCCNFAGGNKSYRLCPTINNSLPFLNLIFNYHENKLTKRN